MRVFVLSTGRCGSETFTRACAHISNFTAAHESNAGKIGEQRLQYPEQHIESDNRLSWYLGELESRYGDDAFYVHLHRDVDAVAKSYNERWGFRESIIEAFAYGITQRNKRWPNESKLAVCRYYVETVNSNIDAFLKTKSHVIDFPLENAKPVFRKFWASIDATGDLEKALSVWDQRYNRSRTGPKTKRLRHVYRTICKVLK